jgi:hypothetical protein
MKANENVLGEAIRIEVDENTGKLLLVFEITNPLFKQYIRKNWSEDIEFRMIDKKLILNDDK